MVGAGVGEQHARSYARLSGCRLRWVYDIHAARAQALAAALGQGESAESFEAVLADRGVDVVSIASYDDAHFGQVIPALEAGKHLFVEKPLCRSAEELAAVERAWRAGGKPHLTSNLVLRAAPLYRWLRRAIAAGELGDVYAIDGDYLYGRLHKITRGWRKDVEDYSVMQGGGVHMVDLMLWLTGQRPATVRCSGNRIATQGSAFRYNDYMSATYTFPSGLIGRITANFSCVHKHQHVLRVFGTKATFIYDDAGARLHTTRDPESLPIKLDAASLPATKGDLIPEFIEGILAGQNSEPAFQHEVDVIRACTAADEAVKSAQTVEVKVA